MPGIPLHVPAWKKLGLKLKFANENSTPDPSAGYATGHKRKNDIDVPLNDLSEPVAKKLRPAKGIIQSIPQQKNSSTVDLEHSSAITSSPQPAAKRQRKKSVSFAQDTKSLDGDTATTIDHPPGSPGSTPKKPKREKKPKSERKSRIQLLPRKSADILDYLEQHYQSRSSWKFNKNREIWILKHVLSTDDIPVSHNRALTGYLRGLKSSAARLRLIEECQDALRNQTEDDDSTSKQDDKRLVQAFITSLDQDEPIGADGELDSWVQEQRRPKLILWSLGEHDSDAKLKIPFVKKRKARTAMVDVSSSSESDTDSDSESSEDDSDSDSSSSSKQNRSRTSRETQDGTSSGSSSDSSSSDSDSD